MLYYKTLNQILLKIVPKIYDNLMTVVNYKIIFFVRATGETALPFVTSGGIYQCFSISFINTNFITSVFRLLLSKLNWLMNLKDIFNCYPV